MSLGRYMLVVLSVTAVVMIAATLGFGTVRTADRHAVWAASAFAAVNTVAAHAIATWGARRSNKTFFTAVLIGTLLRMTLALVAVYVALGVFALPQIPFVASLLSLFALFLAIELNLQARVLRGAAA